MVTPELPNPHVTVEYASEILGVPARNLSYSCWVQVWPSGSLGFGGAGVSRTTRAYTELTGCGNWWVVFFGGEPAYRIDLSAQSSSHAAWRNCVSLRELPGLTEAKGLWGATDIRLSEDQDDYNPMLHEDDPASYID